MSVKLFLQQLRRSPKRTLLNILLLTAVTAFFCMSVNLYQNSIRNLEMADDTYRTIAIMELHGSVDHRGELLDPPTSHLRQVAVTGYDFSPVLEASGVIDYDLRAKYGVVVDGAVAMGSDGTMPLCDYDVIRFRLAQDAPVTMPVIWDDEDYELYGDAAQIVKIEVLDSASGCYQYSDTFRAGSLWLQGFLKQHYREDIQQLNRSDEWESVTLYPGVEYIAFNQVGSGWYKARPLDKTYLPDGKCELNFDSDVDYFADKFSVSYLEDGRETVARTYLASSGGNGGQPCPIMRWEDVQADPEIKSAYEGAWAAARYNTCAFYATLTNDITGVPLYHMGGAYLQNGRMITREEYETGAKVCMVSLQLANMQGWRVGDKLDLSFFHYEAFPNMNWDVVGNQPVYHKNTQGFFDEAEYEIVGIYNIKKQTGNSGISQSTVEQPWNTIYLPHNSVQDTLPQEELPVHGALLTIWLENGTIDEFLADVEAMGLLEEDLTRFNPKFTFYDQGYSVIQPSLQSLHGTAGLLLGLSSILLAVTAAMLAWFFAQSQKHNVGILRMLGGGKAGALLAILLCALLITGISAAGGAAAGHALSERTGQEILEARLAESEKVVPFRSYVMDTQLPDAEQLSVTARPTVSALAACGALLFPLLVLIFVLGYLGREPRALLPRTKA